MMSKKNGIRMARYLLVILLFTGCAEINHFMESTDAYHTDNYEYLYEKWSREARIHDGLKVELIASATYKADEFLRAYVEEYAAAYRLNEEQKKELSQVVLSVDRDTYEFVFATYVPEQKWDQFDKVRSMWKLYLVNDDNGDRVTPVSIRRVKSQDAFTPHFFPYVTPWKTVHIVTFPRYVGEGATKKHLVTDDTKAVSLLITGLVGTTDMVWDLDKIRASK